MDNQFASLSTGLSITDAQYLICKGQYGNKQWSYPERQTACKRYNEMTGANFQASPDSTADALLVLIILSTFVAIMMITFLSYRYLIKRNPKKNKSQKRN